MMYIAHVRYYNELSNRENQMEDVHCFVPGDSFHDVINTMEAYYGKNEIESITMEVFSPDNFLEFSDSLHDKDLFKAVKETLEANVIW